VGVTATVSFGEESVTAGALVTVTGVAGTSALGSETVTGTSVLSLTGQAATGATGTVTLESKYLVTGVTATANAGIVLVYTSIVPSQTPNWTDITTASPSWSDETPSQNPDWTEIAA
jgi:hypothetical protein